MQIVVMALVIAGVLAAWVLSRALARGAGERHGEMFERTELEE